MRQVILLTLSLLTATAGAADRINTTFFGNKAIQGYDPVAYFTQGRAMKGDPRHALEHGGATWHFVSAEHRRLFSASPEKYAPQYGGYCAYAVAAKRELVGIDPHAWSIVNGRLFLNYSDKVKRQWEASQAQFIADGDRIWPQIGQD